MRVGLSPLEAEAPQPEYLTESRSVSLFLDTSMVDVKEITFDDGEGPPIKLMQVEGKPGLYASLGAVSWGPRAAEIWGEIHIRD